MEQVPTVTMVMSKPATVQTLVVVELSDTESPDDAVGATVKGVADHARPTGDANVTDWSAFTSEMDWFVVVRTPDEYVMVYVPGRPVIPRPLNVATPLDAVAVRVALFVPTTFPVESVAVTTFVAVVTLLFPASRTSTTGCAAKVSL